MFTTPRVVVFLALVLGSGCSASAADSNPSQQMSSNSGGTVGGNNPNTPGAGTTGMAGSSNGNTTDPGNNPGGPTGGSNGNMGGGMAEVDGGSAECYSPTQNTDTAYDQGSIGCPCDAADEDVCVSGVALICEQGFWQAVEDGPCQPMFDPCAAQDVMMVGGCEPAPVYFWNGTECVGQSGCSCEGADCDAVFPNQADCEASYTSCGGGTFCGGFAGFTCTEDEYCAYEPGQYCGAADASATCKPKPVACTKEFAPVCGCDGMNYGNACEANAAGTGVYNVGNCEVFN